MAKYKEKIKARKLRKSGESIKVIAKLLNVSTSSVSLWCRDIQLTESQIKELERRSKDPFYGKRLKYALKQQKLRKLKNNKLRKEAIEKVGQINDRELFLVGIALYWGEGFKKDSQAGFANLDPKMIKIFLKWLKVCFNYKNEDLIFRLTINESHKYREEEIKNYWIDELKLVKNSFQKTYFQKVKWKKEYENPENYKGVLRIKVRKSTDFLRKIHGWIEGLSLQA